MQGKCHDINSVSLSVQKFLPSREQILYGNDMLVRMKLPPSALSLSLSLSLAKRYDCPSSQRGISDLDGGRSAYSEGCTVHHRCQN